MLAIRQLINRLNQAKVSYIVVGGIAVVLHGRSRLTMDLDLVVRLDRENLTPLVGVLNQMGFQPRIAVDVAGLVDPEIRQEWINSGMKVFSFADPANGVIGVDLFVEYPMPYEQMLGRSIEINVGGVKFRTASIDDLIAMKKAANRTIDQIDVMELEIIRDAKAGDTQKQSTDGKR